MTQEDIEKAYEEAKVEKEAKVPRRRTRIAKPKVEAAPAPAAGLAITRDDLLAIIKAAREPNELEKLRMDRELAKEAEDAKRVQALREEMVKIATIEIEGRQRSQMGCSHKKEKGETAIMGQIHSDGLYHPLCFRCGRLFEPVAPPREFLAQGIMVD